MAQYDCDVARIEKLAMPFDLTILSLFAIILMVALISTIIICCYRDKANIPKFVIW